jgi:hypothetical protein
MTTPEDNVAASVYSAVVAELVALGAAIACNNEACFKEHFREALRQGVSRGDIAMAVATARTVKEQVAAQVLKVAGEQLAAARDLGPTPGSCCCSSPSSPKNG